MTLSSSTTAPTTEDARRWLDRWDRQQEFYLPEREERFTVIADVVTAAVGRPDPVIVDLGAGPGSLSVRLLDRLPDATVIAIDADPLLLGLGRLAHGERRGLRIVEHDLRTEGWVDALQLPRPADAIVSTTALHWLTRPQLAAVYRGCGGVLGAGGVLVDGDHLYDPAGTRLRDLAAHVAARRAARVEAGSADQEDWATWWDAVGAAPELAGLLDERGARPIEHTVPDVPTLGDHTELLRAAGFAEVGTVWQHGADRVLVAVR